MAASMPTTSLQSNSDKTTRQLPGLSELLSPAASSDNNGFAGRFPSLNSGFPRSESRPQPSLPSFAPPQQSWQSLPAQQGIPLRRPLADERAARQFPPLHIGPQEPLQPRPRSPPQFKSAHYTASSQASSMSSVAESRNISQLSAEPTQEDHRRDSARSNSTAQSSANTECIGQQHFPGRGLCYVFSDGATCPTVIDGELVNPLWGTTKAGKARKRLAQACLNCREKKIRCEPRHPRCIQCEKAKRDCIMPSNQQAGQEAYGFNMSASPLPALTPAPTRGSPTSYPSKRRRSDEGRDTISAYESHTNTVGYQRIESPLHQRSSDVSLARPSRDNMKPEIFNTTTPRTDKSNIHVDWFTDPWEVSPEETTRLLDAFFAQNITITHSMFPKTTFQRWVRNGRGKSQSECMVLYSVLALGAGVSKDNSEFGRVCAERARDAVTAKFGKFNFLLAQARIFLSLHGQAIGQTEQSSEYYSAAVHTLRVSRLHTEEGCAAAIKSFNTSVFDLTPDQLLECMRRTFWAGFLLDTVSAVCANSVCILNSEVIHLQLPSLDKDYEKGLPSRAPLFQSSSNPIYGLGRNDLGTTSSLTHAINICRIVANVGFFIQTATHHPTTTYVPEYGRFAQATEETLTKWHDALPPDLNIHGYNLAVAIESNTTILITSMAAFYHMSIIYTSRFARHRLLDRATITRNIQRANRSAHDVLRLAGALCSIGQNLPEGQSLQQLLSPFFAYAIFLAVDTVCAGGHLMDLRDVLTAVMHGCKTIDTIGYVWSFARPRVELIGKRISTLQEVLHRPGLPQRNVQMVDNYAWRCVEPMEKVFDPENDLMYGLDTREYLYALRADPPWRSTAIH